METKYYSGIGSRSTPLDICHEFSLIAKKLSKLDYILRSGAADGADLSFENGCNYAKGKKEIYIPWKKFNNSTSELFNVSEEAMKLASTIHPAWNRCNHAARKLHGRNCYQILGLNLNEPVEFVICWTPNGEIKGGTATAINLAKKYNILVYNFAIQEQKEEFYRKYYET